MSPLVVPASRELAPKRAETDAGEASGFSVLRWHSPLSLSASSSPRLPLSLSLVANKRRRDYRRNLHRNAREASPREAKKDTRGSAREIPDCDSSARNLRVSSHETTYTADKGTECRLLPRRRSPLPDLPGGTGKHGLRGARQ